MIAWVREVSTGLNGCELSHIAREPIDVARAEEQHAFYVAELARRGCRIGWLPPLPEHPDGVFVEDTALVLPEVAVLTRPGAASRRGEIDSVAIALAPYRELRRLSEPACLDGGDVVHIDRTLYVGAAGRSNAAGIAQLASVLEPFGYRVHAVPFTGCLHLKSACTYMAPDALLVNPSWVDPAPFAAARVIAVDPREPYGANTLTVAGVTLVSSAYPRTDERLQAAGFATRALEVSELHKAEAALTCMSLLLD